MTRQEKEERARLIREGEKQQARANFYEHLTYAQRVAMKEDSDNAK